MTVVVGYYVGERYCMASDTAWTADGQIFAHGPKIYRAGPWMIGESGYDTLLTKFRRRMLDKKLQRGNVLQVTHALAECTDGVPAEE